MKCLLKFVAVVVGSFGGRADAQDSSSVAEAARILAECTKALDADCVIELSDAGRYNRMGSADSD